MAHFYSNENFPLQTVRELRRLGHDVVTSLEAGNANRSISDEEVLAFATSKARVLLTQNRVHFLRLHHQAKTVHAGIVVCTFDPDFQRLASRIHECILAEQNVAGKALRVYRPAL